MKPIATLTLRPSDQVEIIVPHKYGDEKYIVVAREYGHLHLQKESENEEQTGV